MWTKIAWAISFDALFLCFGAATIFFTVPEAIHNIFFGFIFITNLIAIMFTTLILLDRDAAVGILAEGRSKPSDAFRLSPTYKTYNNITDLFIVVLLFAGGWFWTGGVYIIFKILVIGIEDDIAEKVIEIKETEEATA